MRHYFAHMSKKEHRMSTNSRTDEILRLVNSRGSISIQALSESVYASPSTIRRDLEKLEQQGLLRRHHGGAESVLSLRPPQIIRRGRNQTEKNAIASRAATVVKPNSTIFMDASTTVQYMIPYLSGIENLTVYTNGADTAMRLAETRIRAFCTGGELLSESMAYVGTVAENTVRSIYFNAMFFSAAGFDDRVVSDWSERETALRRIVMEQSAKRYFLADHTKRAERFTYIVCRINELDDIFCE